MKDVQLQGRPGGDSPVSETPSGRFVKEIATSAREAEL